MEFVSSEGSSSTLWFEFLLRRDLLQRHVQKENPDPSPLTLLKLFLTNISKWGNGHDEEKENNEAVPALASGGGNENTPATTNTSTTVALVEKPQVNTTSIGKNPDRIRKLTSLKLMGLQMSAYLNWDLEILTKMDLSEQNLLMKQILNVANEESSSEKDKVNSYFLRVLYHRWVLRTIQNNIVKFNATSLPPHIMAIQAEHDILLEKTLKGFNAEESVKLLKSFLPPQCKEKSKIKVPNFDTFGGKEKPDWTSGVYIPRKSFESIIRIDLGIYHLYKGEITEAIDHFKAQSIPLENFPYLKISKEKLNGYLKALDIMNIKVEKSSKKEKGGKKKEPAEEVEEGKAFKLNQLSSELIKGNLHESKKILNFDTNPNEFDQHHILPLNPHQRDRDEFQTFGDKMTIYHMEKRLVESSDIEEIKQLLMRLHQMNLGVSFHKLFSEWELPIPVQNTTLAIPAGPFQDFLYIMIAKSKQLFGIKQFSQSKDVLILAINEIQKQLQASSGMTGYLYNLTKLVTMLDWEILLIDVSHLIQNWSYSPQDDDLIATQHKDLIKRCKNCLQTLHNQSSEINPRSEIVENVLIALVNLKEYKYVGECDLNQRLTMTIVEFIILLAKACQDLSENKDSSSNYREIWAAVLPIFSTNNPTTITKKSQIIKPSILKSLTNLLWVTDRSRSHTLVSLWVSLLARLHNHILDDVALQIQTEYLQIWPNILDDITASSVPEMKIRVSGGSKLNSSQIRECLFHILDRTLKSTGNVMWQKIIGDVHLASGNPSQSLKSYLEYLALSTEFFEKSNSQQWSDNSLFRRMIKCCELLQCFTQAMILCQFLTEVDYSMAFGMAQEKVTYDASDGLYGFIWDLTILEFLVNIHTKRNEPHKRQHAIKIMGLLELNTNNSDEIKKEAMRFRKSQFLRSLAKLYIFV